MPQMQLSLAVCCGRISGVKERNMVVMPSGRGQVWCWYQPDPKVWLQLEKHGVTRSAVYIGVEECRRQIQPRQILPRAEFGEE